MEINLSFLIRLFTHHWYCFGECCFSSPFFLLSLLWLFFSPPLPLSFSPLPSSSLFLLLLFFLIISLSLLLLLLLRVTKLRLCPQEQYVYGLSSRGPKMQEKVQSSTLWEIHYYVGNPQGPSLFLLPSPLRGKNEKVEIVSYWVILF